MCFHIAEAVVEGIYLKPVLHTLLKLVERDTLLLSVLLDCFFLEYYFFFLFCAAFLENDLENYVPRILLNALPFLF